MEKGHLQALRRKQWFYTNGLYLFYVVVVCILLLTKASALVVYSVVGCIFLLQALPALLFAQGNPLLAPFAPMREIWQYEREKLGAVWRKYHLTSSLLQLLLALFSIVQAWLRREQISFLEGIPSWYVWIAAAILIYIGNINLRFHIRRFDQTDAAGLIEYAKDQSLFAIILASIFLVFLIIGYLLVAVIFK